MVGDPYALRNLLPAGTVQLHINPKSVTSPNTLIGASDDWDTLVPFLVAHRLQIIPSSRLRLKELEFLVHHRFLRATWQTIVHDQLFLHVCVYLIPFDLPGAHGCLAARNRDENKLLIPARKALTSLLIHTNRSTIAWAGRAAPGEAFESFFSRDPDVRTLSEIYGDLPSPTIDESTFLSGTARRTQAVLRRALHWDSPPGMRPLYVYQRRTVARMIQQEINPGLAPDPLYIPIHGIHGSEKTFYMQPSSMEILSELPMHSQPRGGILCEEMGTGKTCIVLGLIMATKRQLSSPEEAPLHVPEPPVLTPLALQHFPTGEFQRARMAMRLKSRPSTFPSLVETLIHFIRVSPEFLRSPPPGKDPNECSHLVDSLERNHPFYHVFEQFPAKASPRRKGRDRGFRKVYLTSATLVIVPRAILVQWKSEINKHCDGDSLALLVLDNGERQMPPARIMAAMYDVVLLTHERFASERPRCDPSHLYSWTQCECHAVEVSRELPICVCNAASPLVQLRWKRLVVDEGHVSAARSNLAKLCQELNVERRWIVSGTPTRNLMGLSLGQSEHFRKVSEPPDDSYELSLPDDDPNGELVYPCNLTDEDHRLIHEEASSDHQKRHQAELQTDINQAHLGIRGPRWTRVDRDDLAKLGEMISKFLRVLQFANEPDLFRKKVAGPLLDSQGPCFGAIQVVSQVMNQIMFRHQIRDIERELPDKLPLLKEKTVTLKFQPLAAKTYNVLQALIAVNAVDSERKDQDYFFHPSKRKELRQTLENLTQTLFWRTDQDVFDIHSALNRSEDALKKALERNAPESDIKLVEEAIKVQRDALLDDIWLDVMHHEDSVFLVRGLSPALQYSWLKLEARLFETRVPLMNAERICKLREVLLSTPFTSEHRLVELGLGLAAEEAIRAVHFEESQRNVKSNRRLDSGGPKKLNVKLIMEAKSGSKEKQREVLRELNATLDRRERGEVDIPRSPDFTTASSVIGNLPLVFVGNSASSKINYILRKVLKHAANHKFLIFSAFPLSLHYLGEALDIAQVPYLEYTSRPKESPKDRAQRVVTFETSDKYRVLLVELKLGARGLNLVTASRIIFCEPVWQGDIEAQAIKRAHRIGQKCKLLKVATLVMEGTSEEAMVTRRNALQRKSQKLPAMEEDVGMSKFLQNPTFIHAGSIDSPNIPGLDIPLVRGYTAEAPHRLDDRLRRADVDNSGMHMDVGPRVDSSLPPEPDASPSKKRKLVHFS